jgi:ABC-2 type transport system permease protein
MRSWCEAMSAIMRRDATTYLSYRTALVSQFLGPLFAVTLFYYLSHELVRRTFHTPGGYFGFVVVGLAIIQMLTISLGVLPTTARQELVSGTIERFLVSPHGPMSGLFGTMLFPMLNAMFTAAFTLGLAALIFGLPLATTAVLAIPVAVLGTLAFLPFACILVAMVMVFKQVTAASAFIVAGITLVGGLYFPVALLPGGIRWMSEVQPFTPAADLMRHLLVGTTLAYPAWVDLIKLAAFAVLLLPLGLLLLRAAIRYGQRIGTIVEY